MTLNFNKHVNSSIEVEQNEELLHEVYDYTQIDDEMNVIIGLDGGSTQTRCCILSAEHQDGYKQYVIPSVCAQVKTGKEIKAVNDTLYANLDSELVCLDTATTKPDKKLYFKSERLIRGTKLFNEGIPPTFIETGLSKVHTDLFYMNIIDAIGYTVVQSHSGAIPRKVNVRLGVALPNDDMTPPRRAHLQAHLCGSYQWTLGDKVKIIINIVSVDALTEPEAFIKAYAIETEMETPEYQLHIEVGGRSSGVEVLRRGIPIDSASKPFDFCGTYLINKIITDCQHSIDKKFTPEQIRKALRTGVVKQGRNSMDITPQIRRAKDAMASELFKSIMRDSIGSSSAFTFEDIEMITFSGRTFNEGDYNYSLDEKLTELFEERNPENITFERISENYIPLGLLYTVFGEDGQDFLFEGYEDEDDSSDESAADIDNKYDLSVDSLVE